MFFCVTVVSFACRKCFTPNNTFIYIYEEIFYDWSHVGIIDQLHSGQNCFFTSNYYGEKGFSVLHMLVLHAENVSHPTTHVYAYMKRY